MTAADTTLEARGAPSRKGRRLYLFDIDGTLISTGGAGSGAMKAAFAALWRRADGFDGIEFSGRTDRALLKEALVAAKLDDDFEDQLRRFKRAYLRRLPTTLRAYEGRVLPGVVECLDALSTDDGAALAVGTGNFRNGARMKLDYYGIGRYFSAGGFGDHVEDRALMIESGIRAARRQHGAFATVFVIGDTIHDMTAAKANNAVAVGVTTGPASESILSQAGADIVLANLADAPRLLV